MSVIKAGGETYFLHFGLGALREIERETGMPISRLDFNDITASSLTAIIRAALVKNHGRKSDDEVDAIADEVGLQAVMAAVIAAVNDSGLVSDEPGNPETATKK